MYFCSECRNMYYLKIRDDEEKNALVYYCRNCGHEDHTLTSENVCVSETQLQRSEQKYTHMVNEYTKYDPTLPRINTIKCPNQACDSNEGSEQEGGAPPPSKKKASKAETSTSKAAAAQASKAAAAPQVEDIEEEEEANKTTRKTQAKTLMNREVMYIRYDDINMKYVYLCVHCNTMWRTDNRI
jgi:DNA-directed RNA polymerase subunit M/transcription elongation factor TFIIS